ncbi:hypothetical protein C8R42DRAFT_187264 [Lentinula raphanica]|nr:hypothetical protein C8R42DRAFT_187264 [Lentinula raphanica]
MNLEQVLTLAEAEAKFGFQWDLSVWSEDNEAGSDEELYLGLENVNEEEGAEEDLIRIGDDRWVEDIDEGRYIDDDQAWEDNVDFDCEDEEGSTTEAEDDDQVWNSITDYIDTSSMDGEDSTDLPWNNLPNFDSRSPDEHIVHVLERDKAGSLVTELSRIHRKRQVMNPWSLIDQCIASMTNFRNISICTSLPLHLACLFFRGYLVNLDTIMISSCLVPTRVHVKGMNDRVASIARRK